MNDNRTPSDTTRTDRPEGFSRAETFTEDQPRQANGRTNHAGVICLLCDRDAEPGERTCQPCLDQITEEPEIRCQDCGCECDEDCQTDVATLCPDCRENAYDPRSQVHPATY